MKLVVARSFRDAQVGVDRMARDRGLSFQWRYVTAPEMLQGAREDELLVLPGASLRGDWEEIGAAIATVRLSHSVADVQQRD